MSVTGPSYKAVVFDFDYTLGDSTDGIVQGMDYALDRLGRRPAPRESIRRTVGMPLDRAYVVLTGDDDPERAERFVRYYKEKADGVMTESTRIFPQAVEVLPRLRALGYKIGIVTTKPHYRIEEILSKYNFSDVIDRIIGGDDVKAMKPDPEGLLRMVREWGIHRRETLYTGDTIIDAETASRAGVPFAAVLTGTTTRRDFEEWAAAWRDPLCETGSDQTRRESGPFYIVEDVGFVMDLVDCPGKNTL